MVYAGSIKKGQEFRTDNPSDRHGKATLKVISVTGQDGDSWATLSASPTIRYKRHYNKFKARLWWLREFCHKV